MKKIITNSEHQPLSKINFNLSIYQRHKVWPMYTILRSKIKTIGLLFRRYTPHNTIHNFNDLNLETTRTFNKITRFQKTAKKRYTQNENSHFYNNFDNKKNPFENHEFRDSGLLTNARTNIQPNTRLGRQKKEFSR